MNIIKIDENTVSIASQTKTLEQAIAEAELLQAATLKAFALVQSMRDLGVKTRAERTTAEMAQSLMVE